MVCSRHMNRTWLYIATSALLVFFAVALWFLYLRPPQHPLPLAEGDHITSWYFKGTYLDGGTLETKAREEIMRLKGFLGSGEFTDYELYASIANQYELLGNGRSAYRYLGKAIETDTANNTGLAWHNLGVLLSRLGALRTARIAYEKATLVEPQLSFYHYAYLEFLIQNMKSDTADIEEAFAAAVANLGQTSDVLDLRARWENS